MTAEQEMFRSPASVLAPASVAIVGASERGQWQGIIYRNLRELKYPGRIYLVEPTGTFIDDPNLTDKKYPGNPTKSYRSREPLRVIGEIKEWQGHSPERLKEMKDHIERIKQLGIEAIDD